MDENPKTSPAGLVPELELQPPPPRLMQSPPPLTSLPSAAPDIPSFPPAAPDVTGGDVNVTCRAGRQGSVFVDGEQFPYGQFRYNVCSCNMAPFGIVFGPNMVYRDVEYYTFRLYGKTCEEVILPDGTRVCSTIRTNINKIALRIDIGANLCYNQTLMTTIDPGFNWRGARWLPDSNNPQNTTAAILQARAGKAVDERHIELFLYGLKKDITGGDFTGGTFLLRVCPMYPDSFTDMCKGGRNGMCLFSFVDTPMHRFVTVCRAKGLP
ncbi:hypothetical protein PLESTB_000608100 [Pleodorina starrii]|uniref:Uncharacterized protein n=1 Tax=Pleodorina starrii TaxID=330485 RepID=A0A9W6BIC6_9CHLO|nr:hypothetical protein PLESTM_000429300 [Pleodorina starrii]GLC52315.1 hypothetical protein PLESTB_000608100 [Pleodorina starrii]